MSAFPIRKPVDRRSFLKASLAAAAFPAIVPSTVFGRNAPSNRLLLGSIGVGRMGHGDMREAIFQGLSRNARVVAVCDVDTNRAQERRQNVDDIYAKELKDGEGYDGCKAYGDFRELLARSDIDGVTISTPEHWHGQIAIAAAEAGKDSYVQKPLTYGVEEGKLLVKAVRNNKRILQTGSQQRSSQYFRKTCELVRNGRIGKIETVEVVIPQDQGTGEKRDMPVPANLDYNFWMGPTAEMPYTEHRVHPQQGYGRPGWLQIERYCRGMITGWGAHMFDTAQWGLGTDKDSGPVEVEATAQFPDRGLFDVHTEFSSTATYANGVTMLSHTGPAGVKFIGTDGWIWVQRGSFNAHDREIFRWSPGPNDIRLYESKNHMANFLECMRTREEPIAPVEVGHRSNTVCVITHIAMKLGRKLKWDPAAEQFVNDAEANRMLTYEHRAPWTI